MERFAWFASESARDRLRSLLQRLRDSATALNPAARLGIAAVAVASLVLLGYLLASSLATPERVYLGSGRRYGPDDLSKITRALHRQRIAYHSDDQRRVVVAADQLELATAAISKLDVGPRPPGEIRDDQSAGSSLLESLHDKELREQQGREKILEAMIRDLPGILGAFVQINHPKSKWAIQPVARSSAFVRVETDGDRQLPFRTVQTLTTILTGTEPGLTADSITVVDRRGHKYLDAANPALSALSHNRAREEELSQNILEQLDWISGVRVSVQLSGKAAGTEAPVLEPSPHRELIEPDRAPSGHESKHAEPLAPLEAGAAGEGEPKLDAPAGAINRPLSLEAERPQPVTRPAAGSPAVGGTAATKSGPHDAPAETGRIWVKVPHSYYYQVAQSTLHKEPRLEDLQKLVGKTEEQIKTGVALVVPLAGPSAWKTTIDTIPDEVPLQRSLAVVTPSDPRRVALDWAVAGVMGALAAALVLFGSWVWSSRRPTISTDSAPRKLRYHQGSSQTPGPSERVREFVRRNPESAVSVLERWTSQGGGVS